MANLTAREPDASWILTRERVVTWVTFPVLMFLVLFFPNFFDPGGLILLMAEIVPLFILTLGVTLVIYIGGINLLVQQIANMVTVIATVYLAQFGIGVALIALLAGGIFGIILGYVTTRPCVSSFVSTLAMGFVALFVSKWISGQRAPYMDATLRDTSFSWMFGRTAGVPHELAIGLVLLAIAWFLQARTTFGRSLKAVGSGVFAAIAGLIFSVKLSGATCILPMASRFLSSSRSWLVGHRWWVLSLVGSMPPSACSPLW